MFLRLINRIILSLVLCLSASAAMAQNANTLLFCDEEPQSWVLNDASARGRPGQFAQEIGLGDAGNWVIAVHAKDNFTFDATAHTRPDAWEKWVFHSRLQNTDLFSVRLKTDDKGGLVLIRMKTQCNACQATVILSSSHCEEPDDTSGGTTLGCNNLPANLAAGSLCSLDCECQSNACLFSFCL